jgi:hypothetical protein
MKKSELKQLIRESYKELKEGKFDYEIYHKSFTGCAQEVLKYVKKLGYEVNEEEWESEVTLGGAGGGRARPGVGKTNKFFISLEKNGKPTRRSIQFQVYGMDNGTFELNMYIA